MLYAIEIKIGNKTTRLHETNSLEVARELLKKYDNEGLVFITFMQQAVSKEQAKQHAIQLMNNPKWVTIDMLQAYYHRLSDEFPPSCMPYPTLINRLFRAAFGSRMDFFVTGNE